jgi:hypothetical protein
MTEKEGFTIIIPEDLRKKIEERVIKTNFGSIEEYVMFVLNEVVKEEAPDPDGPPDQDGTDDELTREQEKKIEDKLRGLGYI